MASTWGNSWGTNWAHSWDVRATPPAAVGTIGGTRNTWRDSYDRREVDRHYDEWRASLRRIKDKKAKKVVEEAIEVVQEADNRGLLADLGPIVELKAALETISARPSIDLIRQIREQTELLDRMLDEDEDDIMMMLLALH